MSSNTIYTFAGSVDRATANLEAQYGSMNELDHEEGTGNEYFVPVKDLINSGKASSGTVGVVTGSTASLASVPSELDSLFPNHQSRQTINPNFWSDCFFEICGFSNNLFKDNEAVCNTRASDMRMSMLSNLSTAYNIVSISLALSIMDDTYPAAPKDKSLCSSALIAGMIIGQLAGGYIGDMLGRHLAMTFVMSLQVIGALATAFSQDQVVGSIYDVLAIWRFILGLGCGGVYPLSATITAESDCQGNKIDSSKSVALTFSMQGVGYLIGPMVAWLLILVLPDNSDLSWRLLLGLGAVPGMLLMVLRIGRQIQMSRKKSFLSKEGSIVNRSREVPVSVIEAIKLEDNLVQKLLGTAGCWFAFDILFYGNIMFQPIVLDAAFGVSETVQMTAMHTVVVSSMALPGYFVSILMIGRQSPRLIQSQGFFVMGILYSLISITFHSLSEQKLMMVFLYGLTFFFSNYGPNTISFVLPSMTFSKSCRATLNGICAASGKAGALLGTSIFAMASAEFGQQIVLFVCAIISFLGAAVTAICVSETLLEKPSQDTLELEKAKQSSLPMKLVRSEPSLIDYYDSASH